MWELEEISRENGIITAKLIPMKEIVRFEDGKIIIEYVSSRDEFI